MQIEFDENATRFEIGDLVRASDTRQLLKVIERKAIVQHVHIEAAKKVYYKCEWRRPDGQIYSQWFEASTLEKTR